LSNQPLFFVYFRAMQQRENNHLSKCTPEFELLCLVLSCIIHKKELFWDKPIDYNEFKKLISYHNLSSLLNTHKNDFIILQTLDEFLKRSSKKSLIKHLQLKAEFLKLWDILNQHQFKVTLFKGHYLIDTVYNEKNIRTSTDVDVLIEAEDLSRIKDLLLKHGYRFVHPEYDLNENKSELFKKIENENPFYTPNGCIIDLHFKLFKNPHFLKTEHWETKETFYENRKMEVLPLPNIFVYLIVHGKKHDWSRLKWLLDIVQFYNLFNEKDWEQVDKIINENNLEYLLCETLQLCKVLLKVEIPARYQQKVKNTLSNNFNPNKLLFPSKYKLFKNFKNLIKKKSWNFFWYQMSLFPARDLYWVNIPVFPRFFHPLARPFIYFFIIRKSKKQ
jgi:hypothetical protein